MAPKFVHGLQKNMKSSRGCPKQRLRPCTRTTHLGPPAEDLFLDAPGDEADRPTESPGLGSFSEFLDPPCLLSTGYFGANS